MNVNPSFLVFTVLIFITCIFFILTLTLSAYSFLDEFISVKIVLRLNKKINGLWSQNSP